ncbi:MAG: EamA family transporter [Treponema sp.]|nr:EamA family transporter [Treponema sp.]
MTWILLVLLYGLLKGSREIAKKLAMNKNSVMEVLFVYTLLSFVFVIPQAPKAGGLEPKFFLLIAIKSFAIFLAWICSFNSLKKLPVSLYGILDLSRILFATFFGVVILGETLTLYRIFGLLIVSSGLLLLKFKPTFLLNLFKKKSLFSKSEESAENPSVENASTKIDSEENNLSKNNSQKADSAEIIQQKNEHSSTFYVILALLSCMLNAVSGFFDKLLMKDITSSQLQFWYMLFLIIFYLIYIFIKRIKISASVWKNIWVWILALMFVIGDKALFIANGNPESRITVMTLIKQSGCIVTILGGRFIFKEKNTAYRLFCAAVIILGIVIGVL